MNETQVRHVKRGTEYTVLGQAQMQAAEPVREGEMVIVYRGADGALWVRPTDEFRDGRFEAVPARDRRWDSMHPGSVAHEAWLRSALGQ